MGNTSKHKINRTITSKLPSRINRIRTLNEVLAMSECTVMYEVLSRCDYEFLEYEYIIKDAQKELENRGISFVLEPSFHNPPYIRDALECASFLLNFKVTSTSDIKNIFGNDIIDQISNTLGITTFKDNLNVRSSDSVLLFNIALIYCANSILSATDGKSIPFFILEEKYNSLNDIQCDSKRSVFLFNVYNELINLGTSNSPFSSNFVSLYRAYEYFIIPSNKLIQKIIDTRKEYSRNNKKYNDTYVQTLVAHEKKIKQAQRNLLFYINNNVIQWLNDQDNEQFNFEYECEKQSTLELLAKIINEFHTSRPSHSLSEEYFTTALLQMNSDKTINLFINAVNSLFAIADVYMLNTFFQIIIHLLGDNHLNVKHIDNDTIFKHIYNNQISEESVISFADLIYGMSEISDNEHIIIDTLLYSAKNNYSIFRKICNMILSYNPS